MPHTPGPWEAYPPEDTCEHWVVEDGYGMTATVYGETPEDGANARLIAAAPDLLHCVLLFDYACHHGDGECLEAAVAKAKALIAAAGQKTAEEEEDEEEDDEEEDQ